MTVTRKYYEELLNLLERIVVAKKENWTEFESTKRELSEVIRKVKVYRLFELNLSEGFFDCLESNDTSNFEMYQSEIALQLYNSLGELLYTFETTDRETDYGLALELYRTELPYRVVREWNVKTNETGQFSMEMLFFDMNRKWIELDSESKFLDYKAEIRKKKANIRAKKKLRKIPKNKYLKIVKHYENAYQKYQNYVFDNYPSICDEFSLYNSDVRVYIVDRKGKPGESTKQLSAYKAANNKGRIQVQPECYDFISRFANLEEIEAYPVTCSLGLFKIDDPEEYNFHFEVADIHRELSEIFIRNSEEDGLKDFLTFLLRCELKDVQILNEVSDEIIINRNDYCKLYLSSVPNLKKLKQELKNNSSGGNYSFAAFTSRPDDETISLLKELQIKGLFLNWMTQDRINKKNGEVIHWYVKSKLNKIQIKDQSGSDLKAQQLIKKLQHCPKGMKGWVDYENICVEIFNFLFSKDFRNYNSRMQSYTYDNIFRRDLVVNNNFRDSTSIWGQAKNDFNCNLVVVDFKNYENPLEQNEFHLPSKYLNLVTGNFGIVISRMGLSNSAQILQRRMLNTRNELLLSLDDNDLIGMLRDKSLNQDPSYRLENLKFSLYEEQ